MSTFLLFALACAPAPTRRVAVPAPATEAAFVPAEARLAAGDPSDLRGASPHDGPTRLPTAVAESRGEGPIVMAPVPLRDGVALLSPNRLRVIGPDGQERWSRQAHPAGPPLATEDGLAFAEEGGGVSIYSLGQGALKASFSGGAGGAEGGPVRLNDELAWADGAGTVHGQTGWSVALPAKAAGGLCSDGRRAYVSTVDGHVTALTHKGQDWQATVPGTPVGHPVTDGDRVVVAWQDRGGGGLSAFSALDGALRWTSPLVQTPLTPPTLGEALYVPVKGGEIVALDLESGQQRWTAALGSPVTSRPAASRTGLYVGDLDGRLHRLDKDDGGLIWTLELNLPIEASPTLLPGALLVGLADGRLLTLRENP